MPLLPFLFAPPPPGHFGGRGMSVQGLLCCSWPGWLLRVRLSLTSLQKKERHSQVPDLPIHVSPNIGRVSIYFFHACVCARVDLCAFRETVVWLKHHSINI